MLSNEFFYQYFYMVCYFSSLAGSREEETNWSLCPRLLVLLCFEVAHLCFSSEIMEPMEMPAEMGECSGAEDDCAPLALSTLP